MTMERVLRAIKQERGMSALRNGEALVGLFPDFSRNQLQPQANALKVFVSCQGNTRILNLQNATVQEQQVQFHRLVQEMTIQHNMREEAAVEVCSAFWRVAIGTECPVPSAQQEKRLEKSEGDSKSADDRNSDLLPVPDPKPKPKPFRGKKLALLGLAVLLALKALSFVVGGDSGKRTRAELKPYGMEDSIEDMLLAGTEEVYTYPDGTWMEFYYNDAGQEIYRVYVNQENHIENLFEARYDDSGRLVYHQIFDGEGNLLRSDSYDFHSSEDTAQRRITLGDGRSFQGQSTFDKNGYETFTLNHQDGTKTVYVYKDGGVLTNLTEYDAAGEITDEPIAYDWWEVQPKVCNSRQTVIGWAGSNGYVRHYVQGICGGKMKEYSVEDDHAFIETYDSMGNLLEQLYYRDGQLNELGSREVYSYDAQGNYTGYMEIFYRGFGELPAEEDYYITNYDAKGIKISSENHYGEDISYEQYETALDDQGRQIQVQTFDGETGQLISIDETEYDREGNVAKETRTYYHEDGMYNITIQDGDRKTLSDITYYPSGSIYSMTEYTTEGTQKKWTWYYENGQVESVREYNAQGGNARYISYYESGQTQQLVEYNDAGELRKITLYYENGKMQSVDEYNDAGELMKAVSYYENGNVKWHREYNVQGEVIKAIHYNEDGTVYE